MNNTGTPESWFDPESRFDPGDKAKLFAGLATPPGCLFFVFGFLISAWVINGVTRNENLALLLSLFVIAIAWALSAKYAKSLRLRPDQALFGREARDILTDLRANRESHKYWLYLRPFSTDISLGLNSSETEFLDETAFENFLARVLEPMGKLVALGRETDHTGFGKIETSDTRWIETVTLLAEKAAGIVIVPLYSSGIWRTLSKYSSSVRISSTEIPLQRRLAPKAGRSGLRNFSQSQDLEP
jgi:hypothetical protein